MTYVFSPPAIASVAVAGSDARFPVRRIFCVGRNYVDHVREMGNDPKSEPPIFFTKPADAVVESGAAIAYAANTSNLHFEVELVLAIGKGGADIAEADAASHIWGYAVGVDLTRRDRQAEAKKVGAPWDVAKAFDQSAPIGAIAPAGAALTKARIHLDVNGVTKQDSDIAEMIWSVPEVVAHLSRSWALQPGDLVFTGTPSGVGPLAIGDQVQCAVEGLPPLSFSIVAR
ncbi:fumarylacetoacetate hydrolase family protein [Vitreimonas flagellata]|uniref:fumarylacetoacetate hydrolase family protein n=1 Tax=Vitreimonas flagellata TaxID=2560861 RepID=UPI0010752688